MQLAWSLDRQVPRVVRRGQRARPRAAQRDHRHARADRASSCSSRATRRCPTFLATTGHKLNLAGTAWFSIVMAVLTWTLPGFNAMLVRWRRPDLVRNAPFGKALPGSGSRWIVFPLWIYIFAVIKPIVNALKGGERAHLPGDERDPRRRHLLPARDRHLLRHALPGHARPASTRRCCSPSCRPTSGPWARDRDPSVHRQRLPRRREGVAEVPERDHDERLQGGRRRCSPATSRARRSSRSSNGRPLRDRAVRRASPRERRRGAGRSSSATSPTSATTRSSPTSDEAERLSSDEAGRDELLAHLMNERVRRVDEARDRAAGRRQRAALPDPRQRRRVRDRPDPQPARVRAGQRRRQGARHPRRPAAAVLAAGRTTRRGRRRARSPRTSCTRAWTRSLSRSAIPARPCS